MAITDSLQPSGFGLDPMAMGQWPNTPLQIQQMAASAAIDTAKQRHLMSTLFVYIFTIFLVRNENQPVCMG